jgi:hypothetical protein
MRALPLILLILLSQSTTCAIQSDSRPKANSRRLAHKGYRACALGVYTKHAACMTAALFSAAKRKACRFTLASRLAACRASEGLAVRVSPHLKSKERNLAAHFDMTNTMCIYKADAERVLCRARASVGGTELEKAKKLAECDLEWNTMVAECNAKRHLSNLQLKAASSEKHLLFCQSNAKHSWFWCNFWAKLKGGPNVLAHTKECEREYNETVRKCNPESGTKVTASSVQASPAGTTTVSSNVQSAR